MSHENQIYTKVKNYYVDILAQVLSPCGNFLVAGSNFGDIYVFDLRIVFNAPEDVLDVQRKPTMRFSIPIQKAVNALAKTEKFLIVGSVGQIFGFDWKAIVNGKTPKVAWSWDLPHSKEEIETAEVNAILVLPNLEVCVGCGDQQIYVYSLEDGRLLKTLSGHTDYIHDLSVMDQEQFASAGEDGTVRFWDLRAGKIPRGMLEPYKLRNLERPSLGKWVGCVNVDKEWLICGGGVSAGLWHIPSMQLTSSFDTEECGIHVGLLLEERVFVGDRKKLRQFNLLGEHISSITSSSNSILSLVHSESPYKLLSISGTSPRLDICTTLDCRDQVIICC